MAELIELITNKNVKDTVSSSKETQQKNLQDTIKKVESNVSGLLGGVQSVIKNANNVISQSVSGITSSIKDSVSNFSNTVDNGLKTTLTDISSKTGSMIKDITGNCNKGAVSQKLSFIANITDSSINAISLSGNNSTKLTGLFSSSSLNKLSSSLNLPTINNDSSLKNAISSVSSSLNSFTSSAKSIINDVKNIPNTIIKTVSDEANSLVNSITSSVNDLSKKSGLGDLNSLIKDVSELYTIGKDVYDIVTGKDGSWINGISSVLNTSFSEVQSLLNLASSLCSSISHFDIQDYSTNKDLYDLLLKKLSENGMYKALEDLMNCIDTDQYNDSRTYALLLDTINTSAKNGDVYTVDTIQKFLGNGKINNTETLAYTLALNIDDTNNNNVTAFSNLMTNLGITDKQLIGYDYVDNVGNKTYIYSTNTINELKQNSPALTETLTSNSSISKLSKGLVEILM